MRDAAGAIGSSHDAAGDPQPWCIDAARELAGDGSSATWRGSRSTSAARSTPPSSSGPHGPIDRADAGVDDALQQVDAHRRAAGAARRRHAAPRSCSPRSRVASAPESALVVASPSSACPTRSTRAWPSSAPRRPWPSTPSCSPRSSTRSAARPASSSSCATAATRCSIVGRDGRIRYQTPSVVRVLGYLAVDLDGADFERVLHPDAVPHVADLPRAARARRARDGAHRRRPAAPRRRLGDPRRDRRRAPPRQPGRQRHRAHDPRRHRSAHARGPAAPPGVPRRAHRACRTGRCSSTASSTPWPASAAPTRRSPRSPSSTSTTSSSSTTASATAPATSCSAPWPTACAAACAPATRRPGSAATSSPCSSRTPPTPSAVVEVAERILDALHEPIVVDGREVYARASIGIATRRGPTTTPDELLRNADLAMYTAKANGKGCIEMFEPAMHHRAVDRLAIRGELERAVEQGEIARRLPADRAARLRRARGLRGAGPLDAPRAGRGVARPSSCPSPRTPASSSRSASWCSSRRARSSASWLAANPTAHVADEREPVGPPAPGSRPRHQRAAPRPTPPASSRRR